MALFKGQSPRKGGGRWWDVVKLKPGHKWRGWLAGEIVGVDTHFLGSSRPCHAAWTDGALACPMCEMGLAGVFKAYVPLWSESGTRSLLITGERYWETMVLLRHLQPVMVSMASTRGHPYCCGGSTWTALRPQIGDDDARPQDLTPHLLQMWRDEVISSWVANHPVAGVSDTPVSPPPVQPVPHSTGMVPPVELVEEAHRRRKAAGLVVPAGPPLADFPALAARLAEGTVAPTPNGKPKVPKKG